MRALQINFVLHNYLPIFFFVIESVDGSFPKERGAETKWLQDLCGSLESIELRSFLILYL